jgi:hypothetical protein
MSLETLVIKAARKKWRFITTKGHLSFEDLWDLSLEALDKIAVALDEKIQKGGRKSFITKRTESMTEEQGMFDLVSYVIETKMAEADAAKDRAAKRGQREFLEELKKKKQIATLEGLSLEEIDKQIAALDSDAE